MPSIAIRTAQHLLNVAAVKLNNESPFTWASGRKSPIYCDNRLTLSYPEVRSFITEAMLTVIKESWREVDVIAGVATGGIAQGALVAQALNKPFVYIRAEEKKHGMNNRIEGRLEPGQKVLVIEDLVSTGKSSLLAVDAIREAQCEVIGMVAIFTYGLPVAEANFKNARVYLETLTSYSTLVECAIEKAYVSQSDLESLHAWRSDPEQWSNDHM